MENSKKHILPILVFIAVSLYTSFTSIAQVYYSGKRPERASISAVNNVLSNNILEVSVGLVNDRINKISFRDKVLSKRTDLKDTCLFELKLNNGKTLYASDFHITSKNSEEISANPNAIKMLDRLSGKQLVYQMSDASGNIRINWSISLHNDCNFIQQHFNISDAKQLVNNLTLVNIPKVYQPELSGKVDGSPVLSGPLFFAIEHPMAQNQVSSTGIKICLAASAALHKADGFEVSVAWGTTPTEQLRRGFLYYLEKVRAVPYRAFPHYNSWYDVGYDRKEITEGNAMDRIKMFGDSLVLKRKTKISAFLWDSGWDDYKRLWYFSNQLPNGFKHMDSLAKKYNSNMGVWVSPWGGYGEEQTSRLASIKTLNLPFKPNDNGLSLADKSYFTYFKKLTEDFVKDQGVVSFKFDGVGAGNGAAGAGEKYAKDLEAFLRVISDLRDIKPDLYFNLTVGTWPSPYWLSYGDAIWRAGGDMDLLGAGTKRQQWINYRDAEVYKNIVKRSRLYPLNALMYHGIVVNNENGIGAEFSNDDKGITEDIWEFFSNGTGMQELYINPHLLSSKTWDELARAMKWSEQHQQVLSDVHWVGGDPAKEDIYGFAAWNKKEGILTWRNPSAQAKQITFSLKDVLELPASEKQTYAVWNVLSQHQEEKMVSDGTITLNLQPFEVKILELK
ncbi:hypothetical protein [Pedobacter nutrimenti]|uniref:hypothetical protein n=1 Tax=Pedobacter nutrimenti TaxID=1241337 RepID=UPI00292FF116|nr:hypothetical protein [Pedobacter nutrimenti]